MEQELFKQMLNFFGSHFLPVLDSAWPQGDLEKEDLNALVFDFVDKSFPHLFNGLLTSELD